MKKQKYIDTAAKVEKAILVSVSPKQEAEEITQAHLAELAFLAKTLGVESIKTFTQKLEQPQHKTFVGKGKLQEIQEFAKENEPDLVIFDDDLNPSQVRNLENAINGSQIKEAKCKILDRSLLILDIFALRAQTAQAKAQVELAQYQYLLPRLTRMWTHLSKQKGGIGMRGPGEKELETDRRIVQDYIKRLKDKLAKIDTQNTIRRKSRQQQVRVALVGYTNVGKSTLMRVLSKEKVLAEDKLFATVDSTVRKVVLENIPFLLTDTVGFIRKLPTTLIESFKSTLAEVAEADILMHVIDVSSPDFEAQVETVHSILQELKAMDKKMILVFNKIDLVEEAEKKIKNVRLPHDTVETVLISAEKKENMEELRKVLIEKVKDIYFTLFPNYLNYKGY